MEYFEERDLGYLQECYLRERSASFSEEETKQVVRQLVGGIQFMHNNGFAHRDLKPGVSLFHV
jgi:serine/threonine protein kinase